MRRLARWVAVVVVSLAFVAGCAGVAVVYLAQRALPATEGTLPAPGLKASVQVLRDATGIPHIYAQETYDLFFAQGYVTAQDRLWQMEFNRRLATGRLSEVFGPLTVEVDRFFRTLGLGKAADEEWARTEGESRQALQAYADGVNAYVASRGGVLPVEFSLLLLGFEPWQPRDSLAWGKTMAWQLSGNLGSELLRAELVGTLGAAKAAALMPADPPGALPDTAPEIDYAGLGKSVRVRLDRVLNLSRPRSEELGSNNWVVAGGRTASGKPLLANDTHLGLQLPPVWYEVHLVGGGLNVIGFSLPGAPGVVIGHNEHIAWGMTNTGADVQDLFVERRNPDHPGQYLFQGRWEEARVWRETIHVRGWREPLRLEVPVTRHGPVLNADAANEDPISLQWTAYRSDSLPISVLAIARARDWNEFRAALRSFDVPAQNFVYADVAGNVGFQLAGLVPVRASGDGLLPVPGWSGQHEWEGHVPFEALPSAFNPAEGFLATANDRVASDGYQFSITREWAPRFRVERLNQVLNGLARAGTADMTVLQADQHSLFAAQFVPRLLDAGRRGMAGGWGAPAERVRAAVAVLESWDYAVGAESPGAAVFNVFYNHLVRDVFADDLGEETFHFYQPASRSHVLALSALIRDADSPWFDDARTPRIETRDEIVWCSLSAAAEALARRFGDDPARWRWGDFHTVTFAHPLAQVPLLDQLFNRGPFPRGGDGTTLNVAGYSFLAPYRESHHAAMRMVLDLSDWDHSLAVLTLGQSGQPYSPHYDDQLALWLRGDYRPLPFSRAVVEQSAVATLTLAPR